jgi:DNA invertase Pin-like site-specific DNA recombinase
VLLLQVYRDAAISGATTLRPAYQALLQAARDGGFDVLVAEALDRLSRDQEDVAALFKRLRFAGIRIVTLAEGEISELHVGLKGTMNALFLKDLAAKTHRGLRGRVTAGKSAGGRSFGHDVVRQIDAAGRLRRDDHRINPSEAAIVCRIFEMFASGTNPIAIGRTLSAEHIPGPQGTAWRDTTIPRPRRVLHRHPAQRALRRPAVLEPLQLCQRPAHLQARRASQRAGAARNGRDSGAAHDRPGALAGC